jgi:hypothetical protein
MERNKNGELVAKQNHSIVESLNWFSYVANNPIRYVDPTGNEKLSYMLLDIITGGNADEILDGIPNASDWLNITDKIYFTAALFPLETVNSAASITKYGAILSGNAPLAGAAGAVENITDYATLGVKAAYAWSVDSPEAWGDVLGDAAGLAIGAFVSTKIEGRFAEIEVRIRYATRRACK